MNTTEPPPTTPHLGLLQLTEYRIYDGLVATGFLICLVIGLPGNCLALRYFLQTGKRNLSTLLYMIACCIDLVSSMIHLPVTVSWLNSRHPGPLTNRIFCLMWYFCILLLQLMSIFLVMVISLTRTIVIIFPFYKVKKQPVLICILVMFLYHCTWNVIYMVIHDDYYSYGFGYCDVSPTGIFSTMYMINYCICTGIPPLIVLISVVSCTARLHDHHLSDASQRRNRQASLTIIYFSVNFLICNSLTLLNNAIYTVTIYGNVPYSVIYNNKFMLFYSWLISEIFCTVLNAALNPLLYLWRMKAMRIWIKKLLGSISRLRKRTVSTSTVIFNTLTQRRSQTESSL